MIYLYDDNKSNGRKNLTPSYITFNNFNNALFNIFKRNNIDCQYLSNNILTHKDILIAISAMYLSNDNIKKSNCKIIIINSEKVMINSNSYIEKYINNPKVIEIWDYQKKNIKNFKTITSIPCYYVPITYDPFFETIYNFDNKIKKDIDIAFFGSTKRGRRRIIVSELEKKYVVWWGNTSSNKELEHILNRSKIVIIIHYYQDDLCIDYHRLFSLISNKVFVINEKPTDDSMDNNMDKLIFASYNNFIKTCDKYLAMTQKERDKITEDTYQWWKTEHKFVDKIPKTIFNLTK